jgi:chromosome segregation ATPase
MKPTTIDSIVNIVLHPTTDEHTAVAAFRKLHQHADKFGGLASMLGGTGTDMRHRLNSAQNEIVELRAKFDNAMNRVTALDAQFRRAEQQMTRQRQIAEEAEAQCREKARLVADLEAELAALKAKEADDDLGIIAQRNSEIEALTVKLKSLKETLSEADALRERYAADAAAKARQEVEQRIRAAMGEKPAADPQPEPARKPRRKARPGAQSAASAQARPRARTTKTNRKGADMEALILSLLTNRWKAVSSLYSQAQRFGFMGSEGTIRFAADRLVDAGNAMKGHDSDGRIAYRRAYSV